MPRSSCREMGDVLDTHAESLDPDILHRRREDCRDQFSQARHRLPRHVASGDGAVRRAQGRQPRHAAHASDLRNTTNGANPVNIEQGLNELTEKMTSMIKTPLAERQEVFAT